MLFQNIGWDNIEHKILFTNLSKEEAEKIEIELIAKYKTTDSRYGYNVANGGSTIGKYTEETKRKISNSKKGRPAWNKGILRTKEEKQKMSLGHIGKTVGSRNGKSKPIICIETNIKYECLMEAERKLNISHSNICLCLKGKQKTAGGYHWKYVL